MSLLVERALWGWEVGGKTILPHHPTPSHPRLPGSRDAQEGAGPFLQALLPPGSTEEPYEGAGWACQAWVPWSSRGALRTLEAGRLCRSGGAQQRLAFTGVSWQSPAHHQLRKLRLPRADPGPACCPIHRAAQLWIIRGRENPKPVWWQA